MRKDEESIISRRTATPPYGKLHRSLIFFFSSRWIKSLSYNLLSTIAVSALALASLIYLARSLDHSFFGIISGILIVFGSVSALDGLRPVLIHKGSGNRNLIRISASSILISFFMFSAVFIAFIAVGYSGLLPISSFSMYILGAACGLYFPAATLSSLLDAQKDTILTGISRNACWLALYILFIVITYFRCPIDYYISVLLLFNITIILIMSIRLFRNHPGWFNTSRVHSNILRDLAREGSDVVGINLSALVLGTWDRMLLGWMTGAAALGLYSPSYELATKPTAFMRVIANVSLPEFRARIDHDENLALRWIQMLSWSVGFTALITAVFIMARSEIILILFGAPFSATSVAFGLLLAPLPLLVMGFFSAIALQAAGQFSAHRRLYVWGAITTIAMGVPLIYWRPLEGAALTYAVSRWVDFGLLVTSLRSLDQMRFLRGFLVFFAGIIILIAASFSSQILIFASAFLIFLCTSENWRKKLASMPVIVEGDR